MGTYDLTTATLLIQYEGITGTGDNTMLGLIIERVTGLMEAYCGRKFLARAYSYLTPDPDAILDGLSNPKNTRILALPQYPINSVTTVRINETVYPESTGVYKSGWFIAQRDKGYLGLRGYSWLAGMQNIELVYNAGYDSSNARHDEHIDVLGGACLEQSLWLYKKGKKDHLLGLGSKSLADGSIGIFSTAALLPSVKLVLNLYQEISIS